MFQRLTDAAQSWRTIERRVASWSAPLLRTTGDDTDCRRHIALLTRTGQRATPGRGVALVLLVACIMFHTTLFRTCETVEKSSRVAADAVLRCIAWRLIAIGIEGRVGPRGLARGTGTRRTGRAPTVRFGTPLLQPKRIKIRDRIPPTYPYRFTPPANPIGSSLMNRDVIGE